MTAMDEAFSPEQLEQLKSLRPGLSLLEKMGADRFDPCRFRYIDSMARRALDQRQAVAQGVEANALKALRDYLHDFSRERECAAVIVAHVTKKETEQGSASAAAIQELFECCDFRAVVRMQARLQGSTSGEMLKSLRVRLEQDQGGLGGSPQELCFEEFLRQQEDDLVTSFSDPSTASNSIQVDRSEQVKSWELKSVRRFRESLLKRNAEKLVAQAIEHAPENPGPLNPQMLVIHSLATMRDLSPHYMHRFVSYIDTLLWLEEGLEQANKQSGPASAKNPGARPGRKR